MPLDGLAVLGHGAVSVDLLRLLTEGARRAADDVLEADHGVATLARDTLLLPNHAPDSAKERWISV